MTLPPFLRAAAKPLRLMGQDRMAMIGLAVLSLVILMALFAPLLATHDPHAINEIEDGSLLERDGDRWVQRPSLGTLALNDAASRDGRDLAVGRAGTVWWRADRGDWEERGFDTSVDLHGVALSSEGRGLIVGAWGTILIEADGDWTEIAAPDPDAVLHGVSWYDADTAFITGAGEEIWRLDAAQGAITALDSPVGRGFPLYSVTRDHDDTMLAVGERGLVIRIDPADDSTELLRLPSSRDLNHVHISDGGAALVVGERGTLLRRPGPDADWLNDDAPDTRALRAGWIDDDGNAIAVGRSGNIMEWDGAAWHLAPTESERHFRAILASGDQIFALGSDNFVDRLARPSAQHWFGTDHIGRDLYSQNVYGSQIALMVGFIAAGLVVLIGTNVGLIAGYFRGRTESVLMRTVDVLYGIPTEPFALILVLLFGPSLLIIILAIALLTWRTVARLIRSQVLSLRERPFVKAARVAGASHLRIMYLHIFPNVLPLVFLELAIITGAAIIAEATLSFLGLGAPQSISWGGILHDARLSGAWRTAWWWNLPPGAFIMLTVMSVFFISRSLEVIANPRLRARQ